MWDLQDTGDPGDKRDRDGGRSGNTLRHQLPGLHGLQAVSATSYLRRNTGSGFRGLLVLDPRIQIQGRFKD